MQNTFKDNFIGYFRFFYKGTGYKLIINYLLCIVVSLLDGIGLAMFMPLLQAVGDTSNDTSKSEQTLGQLHYVTDFLKYIGVELTINTVLTILIILFVGKGIIKFIQLNYQVNLRFSFVTKLRKTLINQLHQLSFKGFLKLDAGKIQNVFTAEMQRLYQALISYLTAGQSFVMLATYIALAFIANFQFAFFVAAGAGLSNIIYRKIYKATIENSFEISRKGNKFNGYLIQAIHNFKYLKATDYFQNYKKKLNQVIDEVELLNKKIGFYNSLTQSIKEPIIVIIVMLVVKVELNIIGASLSSILLSLLLFYRALGFLILIQNNWQNFTTNVGAIRAVTDFSNEMSKMKEVQATPTFNGIQKELNLQNIQFSYGKVNVINDLDIHIHKNTTVAFVGESGSGKSTLANIVAGLLEPEQGNLKIDGVCIKEYNIDTYRRKIGYISQEPVIFNDNIFNNVTFWDEPNQTNLDKFWKTIELASLTTFIKSLPDKENTLLGNNGILISGGQKQRISIARELYKKAEILIMDEATSALDSETEKIIQENIERLHGSYTMIIIAHRLSTIKKADIIYLIEKGRITASGTFNEMINYSERFKRMVSLQEI